MEMNKFIALQETITGKAFMNPTQMDDITKQRENTIVQHMKVKR